MADIFFIGVTVVPGRATNTAAFGVESNLTLTNSGPVSNKTATNTAMLAVLRKDGTLATQEPYSERDQLEALKQHYSLSNILKCGTCPESVVNMIRVDVAESLKIVMRLKRLTTILNRALAAADEGLLAIIHALIDAIPSPPLFNIKEILGLLTCPLTPQAVAISIYHPAIVEAHRVAYNGDRKSGVVGAGSTLNPAYWPLLMQQFTANIAREKADLFGKFDPKTRQHSIAEMWQRMVEKFWRDVQDILDQENPNDVYQGKALLVDTLPQSAPDGTVVYTQVENFSTANLTDGGASPRVSFARTRYIMRGGQWLPLGDSRLKVFLKTLLRLTDEMMYSMKNVGYFAIRLSVTKGSVALVRATCPNIYENVWPFKRFDEETRNFSMLGVVPSGLDARTKPYVEAMMRLQCKITQWQTASFVITS